MSELDSDQPTQQMELARREPSRLTTVTRSLRAARVPDLVKLALFGVVTLLVTVSMVAVSWTPRPDPLEAGDITRETFMAPFSTSYTSTIRTDDQREEAHNDIGNIVQTHDGSIRGEQVLEAERLLSNIEEIRDGQAAEADKVTQVFDLTENITRDEAVRVVQFDAQSWDAVFAEVSRVIDSVMTEQIRTDEVAVAREDLSMRVSARLTAEEQSVAAGLAEGFIRPNVFIDDRATEAARQQAANEVEPVTVSIQAGQAIVRDGDIVSRTDVEALQELGIFATSDDGSVRLGKSGLMSVFTLFLVGYLYAFSRQVWEGRQLILLAIVLLAPVLGARFILPHDDVQYMFPTALSAMLVAILLNFQLAAVVSIVLAFYLGIVSELSFELAAVYFIGAVAGSFVIYRAERTITFIWAGAAVTASTFVVALCFRLLAGPVSSGDVGVLLAQTSIAGALSASITFLSFSVLGSLFGITTHLQLLDLLRPNQPLLNRLAREAPGTYHHSIIVSNLAESAVTIVGGDALLARVAVLYHDIGKLEHPTFFIENQANLGNVHDQLDPRVSARVIFDHVSDGVTLAKKAHLPKPIVDIIQQHHGTTLVQYFYTKALSTGLNVSEDEFRYAGPRPQTKESAIVMLADSVEAAVRSMAQSGRLFEQAEVGDRRSESERLREFVQSIIDARVTDGQLSECDLTLRDIDEIRAAFVQILEGIYHPRVEYPAALKPVPPGPVPAAVSG